MCVTKLGKGEAIATLVSSSSSTNPILNPILLVIKPPIPTLKLPFRIVVKIEFQL